MSWERLINELAACGITGVEVNPDTLEVLSQDPIAVACHDAHIRNREEYLQTNLNQHGPAQTLAGLLTQQQIDDYRIVQLLEIRKRRKEIVNAHGAWYLMKCFAGLMTQAEVVEKWDQIVAAYPYPAAYADLLLGE